jgi:citrate lyase beta subunit
MIFSPDPAEVAFAQKIVAAMPDGAGAVMIDAKMQDDATWKQAKSTSPAGRGEGPGNGNSIRTMNEML